MAKAPRRPGEFLPWEEGAQLRLLGAVSNVPGHVVVVDSEGKVHWAYDIDCFLPLNALVAKLEAALATAKAGTP